MQKAGSIASVTVAFNGEQRLERHLNALVGQSRPLDEIIVVDNASTDGTLRLLAEQFPQVTGLSLPSNVGVGGGYAAGLDYAMTKKGHDWVWLFDQDSVPKPDGLERLLNRLDRLGSAGEIGILAPVCIHEGTQLHYPGLLWRNGWRTAPTAEVENGGIAFVDAVISSGSLIRSEAVKKAGPPRADFFIDYVDLEHCLRLRRHGYSIVVVGDSLLDHEMGDPRIVRLAGFSRVWADHAPWREYYRARNEIFTIWNYHPGWAGRSSIILRMLRHSVGILLFGKQKGACFKMMYLGVADGRSGKLGIRFSGENKTI